MTENIGKAGVDYWKQCNTCKKPILFNTTYSLCSVSTCRGKRMGLVFCSYACYDGHLSFARHRSSYCEEETSPAK